MGTPEAVVLAVDVGGTSAKLELTTAGGAVQWSSSRPLGHLRGTPAIVDEVISACADAVDRARSAYPGPVVGVGLIVPGIVDASRGVGVSSMLLGWRDVPFVTLVEDACGLTTVLDHDVRSAARAEFAEGAGRGLGDALFVTLGTGVGAAALIDGELRTGAHGSGGEIAHVVVDADGPPCPCGKCGCVETIASAPAVSAAYTALTGTVVDAGEVARRAARGDDAAQSVWSRATTLLARAVATYCEILDPAAVILGGGLSGAGALLADPVAESVQAQLSLRPGPTVLIAQLGSRAGVRGAALLAFQRQGES